MIVQSGNGYPAQNSRGLDAVAGGANQPAESLSE
jgi:hypothetical protein